ncbi:LURP-one-related/scramblase family protein [Paraclostridium dentum]|uniref:LURP-one-related/scramblase family protein n=1 Tax=Paraclostridium dentum TaxID=2662455 RepID=UPI003F3806AB
MKYYMKSKLFKIKEDFWIQNEENEEVFFVDNKLFAVGLQFDLIKDEKTLYSVKETVISLLAKYQVKEGNEVVAEVNKKPSFMRDSIKIESKYGDLNITGDIIDHNYEIYKGSEQIARIHKEVFTFTDSYNVETDFEDEAFILTLAVIVDDIIDKQRSK